MSSLPSLWAPITYTGIHDGSLVKLNGGNTTEPTSRSTFLGMRLVSARPGWILGVAVTLWRGKRKIPLCRRANWVEARGKVLWATAEAEWLGQARDWVG